MNPHSQEERGGAVKTNGLGQSTTAHLNLTRTMAEVPPVGYRNRFSQKRPVARQAKRERSNLGKAPYAGSPS